MCRTGCGAAILELSLKVEMAKSVSGSSSSCLIVSLSVSSSNFTPFDLFWTRAVFLKSLSRVDEHSSKMIHGSKRPITSRCKDQADLAGNCSYRCRLSVLETFPSVASHLPDFYFWSSKKKKVHVPTTPYTLSAAVCSTTWDEPWKKCSYVVHKGVLMFRCCVQFPSVIALILIGSLPTALRGPDTTDLRVWELSVMVIRESFSQAVRSTASHFPLKQEGWLIGPKSCLRGEGSSRGEGTETK